MSKSFNNKQKDYIINNDYQLIDTTSSVIKLFKKIEDIGKKGRTKSRNNTLTNDEHKKLKKVINQISLRIIGYIIKGIALITRREIEMFNKYLQEIISTYLYYKPLNINSKRHEQINEENNQNKKKQIKQIPIHTQGLTQYEKFSSQDIKKKLLETLKLISKFKLLNIKRKKTTFQTTEEKSNYKRYWKIIALIQCYMILTFIILRS